MDNKRVGQEFETYLLNLLLRDLLKSLGNLADLVGLATVDQAGAGGLEAGLESLDGLESTELGQSGGLLDVLTSNLASGGLLEGVDDAFTGSANLVGLAGQSDSEKTGVRVSEVLGGNVELGEAVGGLRQERETGGPFDGGFAAQQGGQDGSLGLEASSAECAGTGERNHNGVAGLGRDTLLTTEVLGRLGGLYLELAGGTAGREVLEELAHPLGDVGGAGTSGNESNVRLGIGILGELGQGIGRQVFLVWGAQGRGDGGAQAAVESDAVSGINSHVLRV